MASTSEQDLRDARRMTKALEALDKQLDRITAGRKAAERKKGGNR